MRVLVTLANNREYAIELACDEAEFSAYHDEFVKDGRLSLDNAYLKELGLSEKGLEIDPEDDSFYLVPFRVM